MDSVIRGIIMFFFLQLIFRISGKRTLAEATNFDLIILLIISETTQQAMVDDDHSMMNGFLLIMTLVGISIGLSLLKQRFPALDKWLEGGPLVIVDNGRVYKDRMTKVRVSEDDVLEAGRSLHGLERMDQIKRAVVERGGSISVIPK
jgi:uncharacterized membrane protein YcaP (DUF421 family)